MNISSISFFSLCSIGLGVFLIAIVGYLYSVSRNMNQWQATQGIIIKSDIKRAGATFSPDIQYRYSVLGEEYIGTLMTITLKQTYKLQVTQDWIAQYPFNKKVNVFYNPERHQMAVLEKGFSIKSGLILVGAALFLMLSGCLFLLIEYR